MKVIDELKTFRTGERKSTRLKYTEFSSELIETKPIYPYEETWKTEAVFTVYHNITYENKNAKDLAHKQAEKMIARELYGEIFDKLIDIREELWKNNNRYGDAVSNMVNELISELEIR